MKRYASFVNESVGADTMDWRALLVGFALRDANLVALEEAVSSKRTKAAFVGDHVLYNMLSNNPKMQGIGSGRRYELDENIDEFRACKNAGETLRRELGDASLGRLEEDGSVTIRAGGKEHRVGLRVMRSTVDLTEDVDMSEGWMTELADEWDLLAERTEQQALSEMTPDVREDFDRFSQTCETSGVNKWNSLRETRTKLRLGWRGAVGESQLFDLASYLRAASSSRLAEEYGKGADQIMRRYMSESYCAYAARSVVSGVTAGCDLCLCSDGRSAFKPADARVLETSVEPWSTKTKIKLGSSDACFETRWSVRGVLELPSVSFFLSCHAD